MKEVSYIIISVVGTAIVTMLVQYFFIVRNFTKATSEIKLELAKVNGNLNSFVNLVHEMMKSKGNEIESIKEDIVLLTKKTDENNKDIHKLYNRVATIEAKTTK